MSNGDGFFKRGKVWWFRTDPLTGKQASSGKRDITSARLEYTERARRKSNPEYESAQTEDASLNGWAVKFVDHKRALKTADTADFYEAKLGHIVRIFGAATPISNALRPSQFDRYVVQRKAEGARATTIMKEIRAAQTLARFAARAGAYHGRPELFRPTELSDDYEPGERFLTPEELVRLLPELPAKRAADVCLRIAIGSRYAEAYRVRPEDVDTTAWLVHVRGSKTKRARATIPIAEPFRALLLAALPYLPLEPWHNSNMVRDLGKACERAKVTRVTANDLRRTHGSWLSQAGVDDERIGKVLRHADGRMARRVYAKLAPEQLGKLVAAQMSATIAQQLPARGESSTTENATTPGTSEDDGSRIENPRVGGSIPSRDTEETTRFQLDTDGSEVHGVAPGSAESQNVRNESATVDDAEAFAVALAEHSGATPPARPLSKTKPIGYVARKRVARG